MKKVIFLSAILMWSSQVLAQDNYTPDGDKISFLHGVNSNGGAFDELDDYLSEFFDYQSFKDSYPTGRIWDPRLKDIARDPRYSPVKQNSYVVAHSMGGLLTREYIRRGVQVEGLVTIGTPHKGTDLLKLKASDSSQMASRWVSAAFRPWQQVLNMHGIDANIERILSSNFSDFTRTFNTIHWTFLDLISEFYLDDRHRQYKDMRTGSDYLDALNIEPEHSLPPASKTYFLWATEDWNTPPRMAQTFFWDKAEDGSGAQAFLDWGNFYYVLAQFSFENMESAQRACGRGHYDQCHNIIPWRQAGFEFHRGGEYLQRRMQEEWSSIALKSSSNWNTRQVFDDGMVTVSSQYPRFEGFGKNINVKHTNHWEERDTPSAREAIKQALLRLGVDR